MRGPACGWRVYKKAFHHGAPLWRYLSATKPVAARDAFGAFAATGFAAAAFFVGFFAAGFAARARAAGFFFAERDELFFFMARSLYGKASRAATGNGAQWTIRFSSKIGRRIASTMNSTTPPMNTMMNGSRMVVSATTAFSTSSS